ncbi:hypothetical protein [Actinomadura rubrisoli]|uniref:Uncharacterized protein n=1 Tax=Actinomadura rubrisoli TaxID=2530368 RepID=A0A4R5CB58_9ACTN|nr:hypothetical protein [Actinomadura rubrisoli]TDD94344.1 hypothetical protein E1298_07030 [Actinomadura rubrisoli]
MRSQFGSNGFASNPQASFLQGGIVARHFQSADVTPFVEHGKPYLPQAGFSDAVTCTNNLHVPACRPETDGCHTTALPTDFGCATDLQVCSNTFGC